MIKTKCILDKRSVDDGVRVCVMRFVKGFYDYDVWLRDLAPSVGLLNAYRMGVVGWAEFERRYLAEMGCRLDLVRELRERSDGGEVITLLCWERDERFCHRRLLKSLIESC